MTGGAIIRDSGTARLEAAGGGVGVVRLTAKMGIIGPGTFDVIEAALDHLGGHLSALVIAGAEPRAFSAGVDLRHLAGLIDRAEALDAFLHRGQQAFLGLATAPVPVVAALRGVVLGGGCELVLHCDTAVATDTVRIGLPEAGLGMVPGWGGCTRMMARALDDHTGDAAVATAQAFAWLMKAEVSDDAKGQVARRYLPPGSATVADPDSVEAQAIATARALPPPDRRWAAAPLRLTSAALTLSQATGDVWRDGTARALALLLSGGPEGGSQPVPAMHARERAAVLGLITRPETRAAIASLIA